MSKDRCGNKDSKAARDNYSRQLNQEHDAYWQSRGLPERPSESAPAESAPSEAPPSEAPLKQ